MFAVGNMSEMIPLRENDHSFNNMQLGIDVEAYNNRTYICSKVLKVFIFITSFLNFASGSPWTPQYPR